MSKTPDFNELPDFEQLDQSLVYSSDMPSSLEGRVFQNREFPRMFRLEKKGSASPYELKKLTLINCDLKGILKFRECILINCKIDAESQCKFVDSTIQNVLIQGQYIEISIEGGKGTHPWINGGRVSYSGFKREKQSVVVTHRNRVVHQAGTVR